jgi:iron complex transport system substrate-binding protein
MALMISVILAVGLMAGCAGSGAGGTSGAAGVSQAQTAVAETTGGAESDNGPQAQTEGTEVTGDAGATDAGATTSGPQAQTEGTAVTGDAGATDAGATSGAQAQAVTPQTYAAPATHIVIDHDGDAVEVPVQIDRVAVSSIWPLSAFLTMYLGSAEKIVGVAPAPMAAAANGTLGKLFPEYLEADTQWVQGDVINVEELMKLDPDVVFVAAPGGAEKEALKAAGIPCISISATKWNYDTVETFDRWLEVLEQVFPGQSRVAGVSQYSHSVFDEVQERTRDIPEGERARALFLFQYTDSVMITSGEKFFGHYWITAVGGENVAGGMTEAGSNAVINMEQVYEWDPEVIYITNFTPTQPEDLYTNAIGGDDWSGVSAVKNRRVYKMPLGAYRTYTPGVDTPLTLKWMAVTMYPDLFADIDIVQEAKDYYSDFFGVTLSDEDVEAMFNPPGAAGSYRR